MNGLALCCLVSIASAEGFAAASISAQEARGLTENRALLKGTPTVVIFLSARCPISNTYGERFQSLYDDYRPRGVRFLFVNSNVNETEAEIGRNAAEHGFTFPIFRDTDSRAAESFGAQATPAVFVLDRQAQVRYRGALDDAQNPARVHRHAVREALDQLLAGLPVTVTEIRPLGCTIKRPRKQ